MEDNNYYVYVHKVKNGDIFYVGQGKGYRYKRHITKFEIEWCYNTIKNGKINQILKDGYDLTKYIVFYKDQISKEEALFLEKMLIQKMGRINTKTGILSNLTDGGDGWSGAKSPFKGKTYNEIYGEEKSLILKEKRKNQLLGNNYGTKNKGTKMSDEQKIKISVKMSKKVKQMDKEFNTIKVWSCAKEASLSLNIGLNSIHNVLSNSKSISAGGYYWEYVDVQNIKYLKIR